MSADFMRPILLAGVATSFAVGVFACSGNSNGVGSSSGNDTVAEVLVATPFGLANAACVAQVGGNVIVQVADLPPCPTPLITGENSTPLGGAPLGTEDGGAGSTTPSDDGGGGPSTSPEGGSPPDEDGGAEAGVEDGGEFDGGTLSGQDLPTAPAAPINGWVEYADYRASQTPGQLSTTWQVPDVPASDVGQTVFYFPSYESSNGGAIIQNVLQYGPSGAGGGSYWAISSWWVGTTGVARHSDLLPVSPGDTIQGTITAANCAAASGCTFDIVTVDQTTNQTAELTVTDNTSFTWIQAGVLEVYKVTDCSQLPDNPVTFTSVTLSDQDGSALNPTWQSEYRVRSRNCNYQVSTDSASVTLGY